MAVKTFDEIVSSLRADEKKLLDNVFSKSPELKEGWLRQDDYSRKMNDLKAKEGEYQEAVDYKTRMEPWSEQAYERIHKLEEAGVIDPEGNELWTAQKTELEKQLDEAKKQALGGEMDAKELEKRVRDIVKENGSLSKEELEAVIASQAKALAEETFKAQWTEKETNFNEKTIPFVAGFSSGVAVIASKYERESGKEWNADTAKELFALMTAEKNFDPYAVQEKFLKPIHDAKAADAEQQRKIDEAVEADRKKRGVRAESGDTFIPQPEEKGNLQKMLERSNEGNTDFESMIAAQAVKAAKELHAEGK
jgi:hypothetical protein